ncbi:MAG TPA: N-acetylmuramoyl-L-alanine amidase [Kofleriaceae bacterium]|nr:N-acetylmuramoyl-L-alanine amidase [Kofleriaceae bacterium]
MSIIRPSGNVIIGGKAFATDARIVNFRDYPYWDATSTRCKGTDTEPNPPCQPAPDGGQYPYGPPPGYSAYTQRYSTRPALRRSDWKNGMDAPYEAVKAVIKQFVIHLDNCSTAEMCWRVLQNERGLSCHFLVDNDGTIYQTLDLALMGYHASEWNTSSIGVELCNWGDAKKNPNLYKNGKFGPDRRVAPVKINNYTYLAFDFTDEQYAQMKKLSRALLRLLPNLPAEYPQSSPGQQAWDTLPKSATRAFAGYIGHYHLVPEKWDPGLWDFKKYCSELRGQFVFPLFPRMPKKDETAPAIPSQQSLLKEDAALLYAMNEKEAEGGYFPVGPWGEHRLWHGGVHLAKKAGDPVFAPFPGRLVAARMGATTSIGSVNFVLLRHQMSLDQELKVEFYSLYMHLANPPAADLPEWMTRESKDRTGWKAKAKDGAVVLLDEPIEAGAKLGYVGTAGPAELAKGQIHLEIFSASYLFGKLANSPWNVLDGSGSGRFCDLPLIVDGIDGDKNGVLSKQELGQYAASGGSAQNRYMVTLHVSEWIADPSWSEALRASKDYKSMKPADIDTLVNEQIAPGLWWDAATAAHCKLPADGMVYHYNPITFVSWVNEKINDASDDAKKNEKKLDASQAKEPPKTITSDREGTDMRSVEAHEEDPCNEKLGLKEMIEGYDAPECKP